MGGFIYVSGDCEWLGLYVWVETISVGGDCVNGRRLTDWVNAAQWVKINVQFSVSTPF